MLRDPKQQSRIVRCQHQDLSIPEIKSLLKEGLDVHQLSLTWRNQITFNFTDEFNLKNIQYDDKLLSPSKEKYIETEQEQMDADFVIMTQSLMALIKDLIALFCDKNSNSEKLLEKETEFA